MKSNYWAKREKEELKWQAQQEADLDKYINKISDLYQKTIDNINREIKADLGFSNGKLLQAQKMPEYERLAKEMVAKADAMRAKGHHVTRKDFSKDVNDRLKIYNATMRINRNEILKSMIGEQLVGLGIEHEEDLTKKLWNDYIKEKDRQAGILRHTTKAKTWSNADTAAIIYGQIGSANFSKRIWADIDGLKGALDGLVSTAIIRGDNPKEMVKWLTGAVSATVGNQKYVTERLARTETARVQFRVQQRTAMLNGYKFVKWYAEGSACKACKAIVGADVGYGDGIYPVKEVPDIPVHPNCMCSIGAYWVEDNKKNANDSVINLDELPSKYLNSQMNGYLGEEDSLNIAKIIDKAPDDIKQVWLKYKDQLKFNDYKSGNRGSFYRPDEGVTIYIEDMNLNNDPKYYQKKYDVFFHEFGHQIDHLSANTKKTGYMHTSHKIMNSIYDDWNNLVDLENQKMIKNLKFSRIEDGKGEIEGRPGYWIKVKKDGTPTKASLRSLRSDVALTLIDKIKQDNHDVSLQTKGGLSDLLSSLGYSYPLGVGHAKSYWKRSGDSARETEAWANLTSATMNNPEAEKLIKKYFPTTVQKFHEALKGILK